MTFLDRLNSPKFDFMQNQSGGKIIKFQKSQALTSNFESFWSITQCGNWWNLLSHSFEKNFMKVTFSLKKNLALCSRNFQNVKLRLDFVEVWSFYQHSDFTWNQILANWNGPKMSFIAISETLNFDFSKFEQLSSPKFTKNSKFRVAKIPKNDIFGQFELPKIWFHVKLEWR